MSPTSQRDPEARYTVVVADKVSPSGLTPLSEHPQFEVVLAAGWEKDQLLEALADADGLVVRSATKVTPEMFEAAPNLQVVGRAGVGVDNIDLAAATERGVPVLNAPAGNTVSAAELAFALMMASARKVVSADRSVRTGEWNRSAFAGTEMRGKTLGLVGAGRIGAEVARRAMAFGMDVMAYDPYLTEERANDLGVENAALDSIFAQADFITLHVPLTASTRGMIGRAELERMKPTTYLINAARGGVVDENALAEALEAGTIAGAALDVYGNEPLQEDSPLRSAPNLILTPHLGASTKEAQELVALEIAGAVRAALMEGDLSRAVNAPAIGGEELRRVRPLLALGERVGLLACVLSRGGFRSIEVIVAGGEAEEAVKPVSVAVLSGLLRNISGADEVNFVNALHRAEARGIRVKTATDRAPQDYTQILEVGVETEHGSARVRGALLGEAHARIIGIDDYAIDLQPVGSVILLKNRDVPGVIGRVGTLLGDHGLNIAGYHQARVDAGGEALAAITVDGQVSHELMEALRALPEVVEAGLAELD
jgi:D-3-phosphoglycerate dehydrogenase